MSASSGKIKVLISRRNKSLAVEEIEELVVERVANMKIEDSVNQMVQQSITDLNLDPTIVSIVESEVGQLNTEFASTTASLGLRLDHIESIFTSTTSIATSTPDSFGGYFLSNLFSSITAWLADATNGITDFFANRVRTKEICLSDSNGETCLTRQQLDTLLAGSNVALTPTTQDLPSSETNDSNSVEQLSTVASTTNETESLNMSSALIPSVVTEGATQ
jgi:hypothetical protein